MTTPPARVALPAPLGLLAELTHRCPLACPYCSNPLALEDRAGELDTANWARVFPAHEAAALGTCYQVHLSGGEPASRRDLVDIVAAAHDAGLYTNLITSAIGLDLARLAKLQAIGLDHVQLSVQDVDADSADHIIAPVTLVRTPGNWPVRTIGDRERRSAHHYSIPSSTVPISAVSRPSWKNSPLHLAPAGWRSLMPSTMDGRCAIGRH